MNLKHRVHKHPVQCLAFFNHILRAIALQWFLLSNSRNLEIWEHKTGVLFDCAQLCSLFKGRKWQCRKKHTEIAHFFVQYPCVSLSTEVFQRLMYRYAYKTALGCLHFLSGTLFCVPKSWLFFIIVTEILKVLICVLDWRKSWKSETQSWAINGATFTLCAFPGKASSHHLHSHVLTSSHGLCLFFSSPQTQSPSSGLQLHRLI